MGKVTGDCRLCTRQRELCNSHIIPEFMWRPVYDKKSRAVGLDGGAGTKRTLQKGLREYMLCRDCEQILQTDERWFSLYWFQKRPLPDPAEGLYVDLSGFAFEPFFRFHLSILWRAAVATREEFSAVSVGPYEEKLRKFLLGEAPKFRKEPSIFGLVLRRPGTHELWQRMVLAPVRSRSSDVPTFTFVFGGCAWKYGVSGHAVPFAESLQLKRPGRMILPIIDYTQEGSISRAWKKWQESQGVSI